MLGERVVVCHSLACAAWFHLAASCDEPPASRVLLVSPPGPSQFSWDAIAGFALGVLDLTREKHDQNLPTPAAPAALPPEPGPAGATSTAPGSTTTSEDRRTTTKCCWSTSEAPPLTGSTWTDGP